MSIYNRLALADTESNYLLSSLGELLMVLDSASLDLDKLENILKGHEYEARYRLMVLNNDETIDYEIPQEDIILNSGSFTENYQQGQRKAVNISLINKDGRYTPSVDTVWVQSRFRFDIGIEYQGEVYWFPRGIYLMNNPTATHQDSDKQVELSLVDKFALFEGKSGVLEATYEIPIDSDVETAIKGILTLDNGSGYPLDLKPIIYDSVFKGMKMQYTLTKDAGSTLGEMLLDIATMLNAECYYNSVGNLCFISINETIDDGNKPSLYTYSDTETEYLNSTVSYDFEGVVNEIQVVGDSVDNAIFSASAKNTNPNSPICIQRIGRRIEYINDSNIYSDELALDRAKYELRKNGILKTTITISVSFNPLLLVNNLITLDDEFFGYNHDRFLIQSISYNIGNENAMTLTVSNLQNFVEASMYDVYGVS